jgi:hypothetical protein
MITSKCLGLLQSARHVAFFKLHDSQIFGQFAVALLVVASYYAVSFADGQFEVPLIKSDPYTQVQGEIWGEARNSGIASVEDDLDYVEGGTSAVTKLISALATVSSPRADSGGWEFCFADAGLTSQDNLTQVGSSTSVAVDCDPYTTGFLQTDTYGEARVNWQVAGWSDDV